ncbi:MAG: hypothetical protein UE068_15080 [Paludibacteraceae bacterium]|jgi:hypothetical protein|nr:hypothetical protein [Paludibacteraceae bacterium]
MKKMLILFLGWLNGLMLLSQNNMIETYFDKELKLPLSNYVSMPAVASFSDTIVNKFLNLGSLDYEVSSSPEFFNIYDTEPSEYGISGKITQTFIFQKNIDLIGLVPLHDDFYCFILRSEDISSIKYDLWCVSKKYEALGHLCLFYGYKTRIAESDLDFIMVDSEILADKTILWTQNDRGLIIKRKFKLGSKGQFYQTSEGVEGEYEY